MRKLISLSFLIITGFAGFGQHHVLIGETTETAYSFPIRANPDDSSIDYFKAIFDNKFIVGLGEATHGTWEFNEYKSEMVRFLVAHCGYRSVIFEGSTGAFNLINDYVHTGLGDIDSLLRQQNYWIFYTDEVRSLIKWLREYNIDKEPGDQVNVYGMDMQLYQPELWYLSQRMGRASPQLKKSLDTVLYQLHTYIRPENLSRYAHDQEADLIAKAALPRIRKWFADNKTTLAVLSDEGTVKLLEINLDNASTALQLPTRDLHFRDSCMAVDVRKLHSIGQTKTIVWAHNGHIAMADTAVGYEKFRKPMGEWLHRYFGSKYYAMALLFGSGSFLALEQKTMNKKVVYPYLKVFHTNPENNSQLSQSFLKVNMNNIFIDLRTSVNPLWKQPHRTHLLGSIFAERKNYTYYLTPALAFDGVMYFNRTRASGQIDEYFYRIANKR